jgi:hypothetical protein
VVFEDAFMDLVEEVGCEGKEDIGMREISSEWIVNGM